MRFLQTRATTTPPSEPTPRLLIRLEYRCLHSPHSALLGIRPTLRLSAQEPFVNANNKIRLGNTAVTVIEGQVGFTASSDKTKKENFQPVDGEAVLGKIRGFELSSWNFIGHDPKEFRHYGPMAQDFFSAFGHDGVGQIGTETTINSGDMAGILMIAVQALEKRTAELKQTEAEIAAAGSAAGGAGVATEPVVGITAGKTAATR